MTIVLLLFLNPRPVCEPWTYWFHLLAADLCGDETATISSSLLVSPPTFSPPNTAPQTALLLCTPLLVPLLYSSDLQLALARA